MSGPCIPSRLACKQLARQSLIRNRYFVRTHSLVPTTFLPLRILSLTSLLGIMSSFVLLAVIIADGTIKRDAPGSLWDVMPTSFAPRWRRFPLSFGLLMSGVRPRHSLCIRF